MLVGDEVAISIDVELVEKTQRNIAGRQDYRTHGSGAAEKHGR